MTLNFLLLICAVIGIIGAVLEKVFNSCQNFLATIISFFLTGIAFGLFLFGLMALGNFIGFFGSSKIFGIHPFWVGFAIGAIREIYLAVRSAIF